MKSVTIHSFRLSYGGKQTKITVEAKQKTAECHGLGCESENRLAFPIHPQVGRSKSVWKQDTIKKRPNVAIATRRAQMTETLDNNHNPRNNSNSASNAMNAMSILEVRNAAKSVIRTSCDLAELSRAGSPQEKI